MNRTMTMESMPRLGTGRVDHLAATAPVGAGLSGRSGARPILGSFHEGGDVEKDGAYELEAGEHVTPAKKEKKKEGRQSKYRSVYLERKGKK
jgi:hypothetical protein